MTKKDLARDEAIIKVLRHGKNKKEWEGKDFSDDSIYSQVLEVSPDTVAENWFKDIDS